MNELQSIPSEWTETSGLRWNGTAYTLYDGTDVTPYADSLIKKFKLVRLKSDDGTAVYLTGDKVLEAIKSNDDEIRAIYTAIGELDRGIQRIQFYNARLMSALNP